MLIYALHILKDPVLPHSSSHWNGQEQLQALRTVDVYIKHHACCAHTAPPTCLCCDSQSILVAYADGYMGSCTWAGKVRPGQAGATRATSTSRRQSWNSTTTLAETWSQLVVVRVLYTSTGPKDPSVPLSAFLLNFK